MTQLKPRLTVRSIGPKLALQEFRPGPFRAHDSIRGLFGMAYWLFKSEPDCFSFDDLCRAPGQQTGWDGVRNFQARNFLRDQIQVGDGILYYHSNGNPPAITGLAEVVEAGHPDPTAFDPASDKHDPKSRPDAPIWYQVAIRAVRPVTPALSLPSLRQVEALARMELLRKGSRLSIQPVLNSEWATILGLIEPN